MKLILSRKGFDSSEDNGGCASPIFPDDTLYSLPIPDSDSKITYGELQHGDINIGEIVEDLTDKDVRRDHYAHLDPDINYAAYPRQEGWRPLFGQGKGHQTHLSKQGVQVGDLFLFFGFYQQVEKTSGGWCFVKGAPELHILWGWLQIGEICEVNEPTKDKFPWARSHPHLQYLQSPEPYPNNTLYIASDRLDLDHSFKGAGRFSKFHPDLVLTKPKKPRSCWRLPRCFYPDTGKCPLTYHPKLDRWRHDDRYAYLQSASRGQEFVLDLDQYSGITDWLMQSIFTHGRVI